MSLTISSRSSHSRTECSAGMNSGMSFFSRVRERARVSASSGLILPRASGAYGIYMLSTFFSRIPKSIEEAARIDGLNNFQIYWKMILPLSKPALISLGIYHFINNWNDLLYPMMLTSSVQNRTLSAGLAILVGNNSIKYGPTLAATVISILPMLVIFLMGQKYFLEGTATSGSKE